MCRGTHPSTHTNLGSNSLVRRKLSMGAKTVGSLSMKICTVGGAWQRPGISGGGPVPPPTACPIFDLALTHSSGFIFQS